MVTVSVANICMVTLDTSCKTTGNGTGNRNWTGNGDNGSNIERNGTNDTCKSALQITTAFLALCGATLLWSLSAGMVIYTVDK